MHLCCAVSEGAPNQERCAHALGCIEDAKVALDVLARAVDDAVYLDEDAYAQMVPLEKCTRMMEVTTSCRGSGSCQGHEFMMRGAACSLDSISVPVLSSRAPLRVRCHILLRCMQCVMATCSCVRASYSCLGSRQQVRL